MTSLTSLQFISISSSVLLIKAAIALSSSSSLFCPGLFDRRCHHFDCVIQNLSERSFVIHSVLCERVIGSCKKLLQKPRSLTVVVVVHSLLLCSLLPCSTCEQQHKAIFLFFLIILLVPLSVVTAQHTTSKKVQFHKW